MLYVFKKEQIEHARIRALAQSIIAPEKGKEVFDEYMKSAFPWLEGTKRRDREQNIKVLLEEVRKGTLSVKPLWQQSKISSRLKHRVVEQTAPTPETRSNMNRLYNKLGKSPHA